MTYQICIPVDLLCNC